MRASLFSRHALDSALGADRTRPLIDRSDCLELVATGVFGTHSGRALQLHRQGFCLLRPTDPQWLGLLDQVRINPLATQLRRECAPTQPSAVMPGCHPSLRERSIVDQADLGESVEHSVGNLRRNPPFGERGSQFRSGPGC